MKITKEYLKQIIKEEINKLQNKTLEENLGYAGESDPWDGYVPPQPPKPAPPTSVSPKEEVKKRLEAKIRDQNEMTPQDLALIKAHGLQQWAEELKTEVEKTREYQRRMDNFGG
jgi:hypothetical protein